MLIRSRVLKIQRRRRHPPTDSYQCMDVTYSRKGRHTCPTISATWLTLVPLAAPKYRTLWPGLIKISSNPPNTPAANLLRNGFQTRYSVFVPSTSLSIDIRFSPYTDSPGTIFLVTSIPVKFKEAFEPPLAPPRPSLSPHLDRDQLDLKIASCQSNIPISGNQKDHKYIPPRPPPLPKPPIHFDHGVGSPRPPYPPDAPDYTISEIHEEKKKAEG